MDAQEIMKAIEAYEQEHGCSGFWGIRGLCPDEEYEIGDTPRESYDWDLEWDCSTRSTTGETIGGTCAVCIAGPGGRFALIHGDSMRYGKDPDEIILSGCGPFESCEVAAVWEVE